MSFRDPIVEEVWRLRAEAWAACGDDLDRYFDHLEAESKKHPERLIDPEEFARRYRQAEADTPVEDIPTRHAS